MFRKMLSIAVVIALSLGAASAALAQSGVEVEQQAPAPPKFEIIRPEAKGTEITRPKDADIYRGDPVINYDPAFIAPFTKETETGRMGLAGWTSPFGVVTFEGVDNTRQPGFLSFGFAISWGGAPRRPATSPVSAPR